MRGSGDELLVRAAARRMSREIAALVAVVMTNRIYHPDPAQPPLDFAGLTVLQYAGDGLFGYEEDYWDTKGSEVAYREFLAAVERCGGKGLEGGRLEQLEAERKAHNHAVLAAGG